MDQAVARGFDPGTCTVIIIAGLWSERCETMVSAGGYLIRSQKANEASKAFADVVADAVTHAARLVMPLVSKPRRRPASPQTVCDAHGEDARALRFSRHAHRV
jgi:hypothetical protein